MCCLHVVIDEWIWQKEPYGRQGFNHISAVIKNTSSINSCESQFSYQMFPFPGRCSLVISKVAVSCVMGFDSNGRNKCYSAYLVYRQGSNISRTKSHSVNASRLVLQLSLRKIFKPGVKPRMKMHLSALLQLHLSDQQCNCLFRCVLY